MSDSNINSELQPQVKTHRHHTITLEQDWQFSVSGPEFDESKYSVRFKSYEAAIAEINKRVEDSERLAAKNVKLDARVSDKNGNIVSITRINRQNGELHGVNADVYPAVLWVREALREYSELQKRMLELRQRLVKLEISKSRGYGRIDADDYARVVTQFQRELEEKQQLAREMEKPKEVETSDSASASA